MEFLSDIELYYSSPENFGKEIKLNGDELKHAVLVMRHKLNDNLFITNGAGKIFYCKITKIEKGCLILSPEKTFNYFNKFENIYFCIPKLKSSERFEFALEKCVELGITNIIIFISKRTISESIKLERWNKIALSAMKQSLRSFLPKISFVDSVQSIILLSGYKLIFDQKSKRNFKSLNIVPSEKYYFLFGPEGGFDNEELKLFDNGHIYNLTENRLRTETAIIKCASLL